MKHFPSCSNCPDGQTQRPFFKIFPDEQVLSQKVPFHWVYSGHWHTKSNEFQTLDPSHETQIFPFQLVFDGQTMQAVPFQLPVLQTQSFSW